MKPVYQTRFGGPDAPPEEQGNCIAACIATIFELDLIEVPDFRGGAHWWDQLVAWAAERDMGVLCVAANAKPSLLLPPVYYMLGVESRTIPGSTHSVVAWGYSVVHDPNPRTKKLEFREYRHIDAIFFIPMNPACHITKEYIR